MDGGGGAIRECLRDAVRRRSGIRLRLRDEPLLVEHLPSRPCRIAPVAGYAARIPDRTLREAAFNALRTKSDVLEGATAFVVLAPPSMDTQLVRAITAFEIAFDYLDTVVELPNPDPVANTYSLGQALLAAFAPGTGHANYRAQHRSRRRGLSLQARRYLPKRG